MSYTAPTLAPGGSASVDLKICAAADANACDHIYVNVVPGTCKSADQTVRVCIDSGATSSYGPDANGDSWAPDTVVTGGTYGSVNTTYFWDQQTDGKLFETWLSNSGDIDYKFVGVPAGHYKVTVGQGIGGNYGAGGPPCESYVAWPSTYGPISLDPYHIGSGPLYISSQGTITYQQYDPGLPPTNNGYQCYQRSFITLPATVGADGNLTLGFAALGNEKQTGAYQWLTSISTLKIETDSTLPYIQPWLNGVSDVVYARGTVQLSPVFWYLPQSTVTYSILSGPGTVNSTGLYTAPSTKPSVTTPVVIQLADQYGNAATQTLWLQGTAAVGFIY